MFETYVNIAPESHWKCIIRVPEKPRIWCFLALEICGNCYFYYYYHFFIQPAW